MSEAHSRIDNTATALGGPGLHKVKLQGLGKLVGDSRKDAFKMRPPTAPELV